MEARLHASQRTAGMAREEIVQEKHRLRVRSQHKPAAAGQLSANVGRDLSNLLGFDLSAWDSDASNKHSGKQTQSATSSLAPIAI